VAMVMDTKHKHKFSFQLKLLCQWLKVEMVTVSDGSKFPWTVSDYRSWATMAYLVLKSWNSCFNSIQPKPLQTTLMNTADHHPCQHYCKYWKVIFVGIVVIPSSWVCSRN